MKINQIITDYIMKSILTAQGDLVVRGAAVPEALAAVAAGQVLKSDGIGAIPGWGVPEIRNMNMFVTSYTKSTAVDEVITGVGFKPGLAIALASDSIVANVNISVGFDNGTVRACLFIRDDATEQNTDAGRLFTIRRSAGNVIEGNISALGADGLTITHIVTGIVEVNVRLFLIG